MLIGLLAVGAIPLASHARDGALPPAFQQLSDAIDTAIVNHRSELAALKAGSAQIEILERTTGNLIQAVDAENTVLGQVLLIPQPTVDSLRSAKNRNALTFKTVFEQGESVKKSHDAAAVIPRLADEQIELVKKQLAEIQTSALPSGQKQELAAAGGELIKILEEKTQLARRHLKRHELLLRRLQAAMAENSALAEKLTSRLESRVKSSIFTPTNHYRGIGSALPAAVSALGVRLKAVFNPSTWRAFGGRIALDGWSRWAIFGFWLISVFYLHARLDAVLQQVEARWEAPNRRHRRLGVLLLHRSLLLIGLTLLFGVYKSLEPPLLGLRMDNALYALFLILLLSRLGRDCLDHGFRGRPTVLRTFVTAQLKQLIGLLQAVFIAGTLLWWAAGAGSLLIRLAIDISLLGWLAWNIRFWRRIPMVVAEGVRKGEPGPPPLRMTVLKGWAFLVTGGGLLISAAGYGLLAGQWIFAWIQTLTLLLLGGIILNALREWRRDLRTAAAFTDGAAHPDRSRRLRLSLIVLFDILLFLGLAWGLIAAWNYENLLMPRVTQLLEANVKIGTLDFSVKGILMATVILVLTHLLVRIGGSLLRDRVLDKKTLERGFKDSVLTVFSYLGWAVGLLLALGTIGVNTTSLAVVFGALSVGIGFGLQTIFNNFVSGLILLFERPIQVGDTIEVNGLWAEVKKINVRATVVQTFDNASVIIPNSELVSQQVTNWSFQDPRMRRNVEVGVAYGSDIDLVENTLLEIAEAHKHVLKYPKADVLFIDHADSALIFRLRLWVHVDHYWSVPHEVRREIDRRFRELGIEIAFPQRDLHLRTIPDEMGAAGAIDRTADDNGNAGGRDQWRGPA
jgi:potassium efflux system protein